MKRVPIEGRPIHWQLDRRRRITPPGATAYTEPGGLTALVAKDGGRWHISVSHPKRYPTWDELAATRERFVPDHITMAMLLPPRDEYVNAHPTTMHLWEVDPDAL